MRIKYNTTKQGKCYYIIRSIYKNGKNTSEIVERLGYPKEIEGQYNRKDYQEWMKERLQELQEKENNEKGKKVAVIFDTKARIPKNEKQSFNIGYLFLQKLYYQLRLDLVCNRISKKHTYKYDLNKVLSCLVYGRILFPCSKLSTGKQAADLIGQSALEYQEVGRALSVLAKEFYNIQAELYKYSESVLPRKTGVLYYDCTNFYFEIEEEDKISNEECDQKDIVARKYAHSKQNKPSPLVQMGLFMDYSGIPLAMHISRGNKNEQITMVPLEKKIISDFGVSKFIICTDSALSSEENRLYNNWAERSYVTATSIKMMSKEMIDWALTPTGWKLCDDKSNQTYDIRKLEDTEEIRNKYYDKTFFKEQLLTEYDDKRDIQFQHSIIVTYSLKYRDFLRNKREGQINRALKALEGGKTSIDKKNATDYRRFIKRTAADSKGKKVKISYSIDDESIQEEKKFDGFYAVDTNLLDDVKDIIKINHGRWEIEESFRIMKEDFKARPVFLSRQERIKAHFLTCFISLLIFRILENKLDNKYTCESILNTLREMRMTKAQSIGYIPSYTRNNITDDLNQFADIITDVEIIRNKAMRGIIRKTKTR